MQPGNGAAGVSARTVAGMNNTPTMLSNRAILRHADRRFFAVCIDGLQFAGEPTVVRGRERNRHAVMVLRGRRSLRTPCLVSLLQLPTGWIGVHE